MHRVRPRDCCLGMIQSMNWTAIYIKLHHGLSYKMTPGDEVEDMFLLLNKVKRRIPSVAAVSSGTIASDYQRLRVESVCSRLGLVSFSYLWKQDQSMLLQEMIASGIIAIMVKVAAVGLHPAKHLGKELADLKTHLHHLKGLYGSNVCGEGGEYETLTLDCPLFKNDLVIVLSHLESRLKQYCFSWEDVLYIHLYIADMNEFAVANETYVSFITHEKCPYGVPSRSTVELPLLQAGLGKACVEVLVSRDKSKKVIHVQSISQWAPSCIGPYSQATLHHGILHLAGQLGLDPPTMTLCDGGIISELEQALFNSEAIADCFHCSISSSAISFIVYCSIQTVSLNRDEVQDIWVRFLEQLKKRHSAKGSVSKVFDPILLFVLVPQLPKRALVEVKPTLFIEEDDTESDSDICIQGLAHVTPQHYWGFQEDPWHDSCLQQCIVQGNVCAVMLSIASENIANICDETLVPGHSLYEAQTEKVAKFCIYVIDKILTVNLFSWENAMYLRVYFQVGSLVQMEMLSLAFSQAFQEFSEINPKYISGPDDNFNLVPVLGSGWSATSMDAVLTCELLAQKPSC